MYFKEYLLVRLIQHHDIYVLLTVPFGAIVKMDNDSYLSKFLNGLAVCNT